MYGGQLQRQSLYIDGKVLVVIKCSIDLFTSKFGYFVFHLLKLIVRIMAIVLSFNLISTIGLQKGALLKVNWWGIFYEISQFYIKTIGLLQYWRINGFNFCYLLNTSDPLFLNQSFRNWIMTSEYLNWKTEREKSQTLYPICYAGNIGYINTESMLLHPSLEFSLVG